MVTLEKYGSILDLAARLPELNDDARVEAQAAVTLLRTAAEYAAEEGANNTMPEPDDGPGLLGMAGLPLDTEPLSAAGTAGAVRKAVSVIAGAMKKKYS